MPANRDRRHIRVTTPPSSEKYTPHRKGFTPEALPDVNRAEHARKLSAALDEAAMQAQQRRTQAAIPLIAGAEPGTYLELKSHPGVKLKLDGLEDRRGKKRPIELVAVRDRPDGSQAAVVFVPKPKNTTFNKKIEQYATKETPIKAEPMHKDLIERIADISLAALEGLWTDDPERFPSGSSGKVWWEVWLRRSTDGGEYSRFLEFAALAGINTSERRLQFEDRVVLLADASPAQLASSLEALSGDIVEVRGATQGAAPFAAMDAVQQAEWIDDLLKRATYPESSAPAVCILDTGVNRGHPLLVNVIAQEDAHTVNPAWGTADHPRGSPGAGHGTEMSGLAAYGDLAPVLASSSPVVLRHRIESVKILPPRGANSESLYGAITATAASAVEIQAPKRPRCFSLAVTAPLLAVDGQPTSWSAAIDALATGRAFDTSEQGFDYTTPARLDSRRLFVVAAGNLVLPAGSDGLDHLERSDLAVAHDPAQAWNALTVGASTERAVIDGKEYQDWKPVALPGDLSPHSATSIQFARTKWPLKPDVVFEGGNVANDSNGNLDSSVPDLCLLTTHYLPTTERPLVITCGTSAATAQVARMAAVLQSEYPDFWPETIRGLLIHSARWTKRMEEALGDPKKASMSARENHVRRYGFGVPSLARAARSATDALTLVAESVIRPFTDDGTYRDMHIYELPWPKEELAKLGDATVRLRVTLSYFIEPNPGRRGWTKRYSYQSHGLRFRVKNGAEQTLPEFKKLLSRAALDEEEAKPDSVPTSGWFVGDQASKRGSIHTNIWTGSAAELAERNVLAVYGVTGWWKEQKREQRDAPYSLIVSIETEAVTEDIWTPVANQVGVPTSVAIEL